MNKDSNNYDYNRLDIQNSYSINNDLKQRDQEKQIESSIGKFGFILKKKSKLDKITDL